MAGMVVPLPGVVVEEGEDKFIGGRERVEEERLGEEMLARGGVTLVGSTPAVETIRRGMISLHIHHILAK